MLPRLAITMGDPAGVGPEICLRLLSEPSLLALCHPIIFGDASILQAASQGTGLPFSANVTDDFDSIANLTGPTVIQVPAITLNDFRPGEINAATGFAGFTYVNRAIDAALAGSVVAVATAPLNKEAMSRAGIHYPGHTEIFAERTQAPRWCMMQYSEEVTCTFVTVHCGYRDVPKLLTTERIIDVIELSAAGLQRIRQRAPKIVVCGLNPHAGEHGLFGDREEERIIIPAIETARARGHQVEGPLPPDTAFIPPSVARPMSLSACITIKGTYPLRHWHLTTQ